MKVFKKGLPYYYPLTGRTIHHLFSELFSPFAHGQSSTFVVKRGFGGGRALVKFFIHEIDELASSLNLSVSTDTHTYVYVDPNLAEERSSEAYEKLVLESMARSIPEFPAVSRVSDVFDLVWKHLEKKELVIVIAGMNYLEGVDRQGWSRVRALQVYPEKVHFLFVLYEDGPLPCNDPRFSSLQPLMKENVIRFDHLSREDIEYSIDRWAYTLECSFNEDERSDIRLISRGRPLVLKACCFAMAEMHRKSRKTSLEDHPYVKGITKVDVPIPLGSNDSHRLLSEKLSEAEYGVFMRLLSSNGGIVGRDDMARIVWGDGLSGYSDAALTQLVRRIKEKLTTYRVNEFEISGVYGKGYKLEWKKKES